MCNLLKHYEISKLGFFGIDPLLIFFQFWHFGVHFIILNSQFYEDCSLTKELAESQDLWLEKELAKTAKHKVIFQHIPWYVESQLPISPLTTYLI